MALLRLFWGSALVPHIMGNSRCFWFAMIQGGGELYPTFTWATRAPEGSIWQLAAKVAGNKSFNNHTAAGDGSGEAQ
jgi:hypothetical protein